MTDAPYVFYDASGLAVLAGQVAATELETGLLGMVGEFVSAIPAPVAFDTGARGQGSTTSGGGGGGSSGTPSDAHWAAIAMCESGTVDNGVNTGGYRTGLYGIEGPGSGSMSPADQKAWANRIYAQYGPNAWGCKTDIP